MSTKPRLRYCDVYGQPRQLSYSELVQLTEECQREADAMPPMVLTKSANSTPMEELAEQVFNAVRSYIDRRLAERS